MSIFVPGPALSVMGKNRRDESLKRESTKYLFLPRFTYVRHRTGPSTNMNFYKSNALWKLDNGSLTWPQLHLAHLHGEKPFLVAVRVSAYISFTCITRRGPALVKGFSQDVLADFLGNFYWDVNFNIHETIQRELDFCRPLERHILIS
jgi:hypothetical protein